MNGRFLRTNIYDLRLQNTGYLDILLIIITVEMFMHLQYTSFKTLYLICYSFISSVSADDLLQWNNKGLEETNTLKINI